MLSRRLHRVRATIALAAFVWSFVLPAVARHPVDAFAEAAAHDEPTFAVYHPITQFEGVVPDVAFDHCDLCHWWRTLGGSTAAGAFATEVPTATAIVARGNAPSVAAGSHHDQPARAPPVPSFA